MNDLDRVIRRARVEDLHRIHKFCDTEQVSSEIGRLILHNHIQDAFRHLIDPEVNIVLMLTQKTNGRWSSKTTQECTQEEPQEDTEEKSQEERKEKPPKKPEEESQEESQEKSQEESQTNNSTNHSKEAKSTSLSKVAPQVASL